MVRWKGGSAAPDLRRFSRREDLRHPRRNALHRRCALDSSPSLLFKIRCSKTFRNTSPHELRPLRFTLEQSSFPQGRRPRANLGRSRHRHSHRRCRQLARLARAQWRRHHHDGEESPRDVEPDAKHQMEDCDTRVERFLADDLGRPNFPQFALGGSRRGTGGRRRAVAAGQEKAARSRWGQGARRAGVAPALPRPRDGQGAVAPPA